MENSLAPSGVSRRELRRLDRRECIIAVASQSFLEHGYAGTTMSAIAAALGGSKTTLWRHFASKEELFEAVIDHATGAYRARISEMLDTRGELSPTLRRVCVGIMEKVTSAEAIALHRLVVAESGRFPEMGRIFYTRAPGPTWALLGDYLESAMNKGLIRRADPLEAARLLTSLCLAGCHQQVLMGVRDDAPAKIILADVDKALELFLAAYQT